MVHLQPVTGKAFHHKTAACVNSLDKPPSETKYLVSRRSLIRYMFTLEAWCQEIVIAILFSQMLACIFYVECLILPGRVSPKTNLFDDIIVHTGGSVLHPLFCDCLHCSIRLCYCPRLIKLLG